MCLDHDHHGTNGHSHVALPVEMLEKWPRLVRELSHLLAHVKDLRLKANPEPLPLEISRAESSRLFKRLLAAALMHERPGVKRTVARQMANAIGDYFLWCRPTSLPVVHELGTLSAWWAEKIPGETMDRLRDIGCALIISGQVVPVQKVWEDILNSPIMFIGHCVCRSSGLANDLRDKTGEVFTITSDAENRLLLDRLMGRCDRLKETYGYLPDTDPWYNDLFQKLKSLKDSGSSEYRLETLFAKTYPSWEFLPVTKDYTRSWIRGLSANRKNRLLHKTLALEMANIFYLSRGTMFTSMKMVDTPYTICSCPSPDLGGGCALTNWYYYGKSKTSIRPSDECFGRRRNESGDILPCNVFPERSGRGCMGCGCRHGLDAPRSVETILAQADEMLKSREWQM